MMQTELLDKSSPFNLLSGSSCCSLQGEVILIGGSEEDVSYSNPFLQIKSFDIFDAKWSSTFISSHNILNRSFHSSVTINEKIYIFGGIIQNYDESYNLQTTKEIIQIEKSLFGIKCCLFAESDLTANQGASANLAGKELNQAVIFGGVSTSSQVLIVFAVVVVVVIVIIVIIIILLLFSSNGGSRDVYCYNN